MKKAPAKKTKKAKKNAKLAFVTNNPVAKKATALWGKVPAKVQKIVPFAAAGVAVLTVVAIIAAKAKKKK